MARCSDFADSLAGLPMEGFVRLKTILRVFPVSKSSWWAGVKNGRFPQPVRLGARTTAWRAKDIRKLIEEVGDDKDRFQRK